MWAKDIQSAAYIPSMELSLELDILLGAKLLIRADDKPRDTKVFFDNFQTAKMVRTELDKSIILSPCI